MLIEAYLLINIKLNTITSISVYYKTENKFLSFACAEMKWNYIRIFMVNMAE